MKKTFVIIAVIAATFAFAGCEKKEAATTAEQSAPTSTMSSATTTAPAAPMHK